MDFQWSQGCAVDRIHTGWFQETLLPGRSSRLALRNRLYVPRGPHPARCMLQPAPHYQQGENDSKPDSEQHVQVFVHAHTFLACHTV
jgi:hypothetical protein